MALTHGHRLKEARVSLERCDEEVNRRSLARPGLGPSVLTSREDDDARDKEKRRQHRRSLANAGVLTPSRSGHGHASGSSSRSATSILNAEQLKDHYKTCITLSSNNKITGRNAFSLQLIDYMSHLLKADGGSQAMNFKLATTALDAGTKIYVARVDAVHSDAQRVADGIVQALDNKGRKGQGSGQENGEPALDEDGIEIDPNNLSNHDLNDENEGTRVKKPRRKKKGKTIASIESITVSKIESNVEIDPIFHKLTTSYDMANVNSLLLGNLQADDQNRLILDSNAIVDKFKDVQTNHVNQNARANDASSQAQGDAVVKSNRGKLTDASEIEPILKDVLEKKYKLFDDLYFRQFNFTNRDVDLEDMSYRRDADNSVTGHQRPSAFTFDLNAELEPDTDPITNPFNLDDGDMVSGGGFDHNTDSEDEETVQIDENGEIISKPSPIAHQSMIQAFNLENFEELKNLLSDKPGEYSYFNQRITNAWAGPGYWKLNPFQRIKAARLAQQQQSMAGRFDSETVAQKKSKKEYEKLDFNMNIVMDCGDTRRGKKSQTISKDTNSITMPSNKSTDIKLRVTTLQKWQQAAEKLLLPERIVYETSQLFHCGLREKMFSCVKYSGQNRFGSSEPSSQSGSVVLEGPARESRINDGIHDEEHECPDDDGFPNEGPEGTNADPLSSQNTSIPSINVNGLQLVDEPHAIQNIQLPFSKFAKRIDVKKLKRVMIDMIKNPETINLNKSLPGENLVIPDSDGVNFSQVYQNLPGLIPTQMGKDMSPPIAFVTLLHLANDYNLNLQNLMLDEQMEQEDETKTKLMAMKDVIIQLESETMDEN